MQYVYSEEIQKQLEDIDKQINEIGKSIVDKMNESAITYQNTESLKIEYLNRIEPLQKMKIHIIERSVPKIILSKEEYNNMKGVKHNE